MNKVAISILLLIIIVLNSCKKTVIEGKVIDGFGKPVKEATVKVAGTQFTSQTSSDGEYSVGYVPGEIKVLISKQGFTDTSFTVKISTEATFPAEATTIYEIPKENGIFISQDGIYKLLSNATISNQTFESGDSWFKTQSIFFYADFDNEKVFSVKKQDTPLVFFDNDPNNQTLFKVYLAGNNRKYILRRNLSGGTMGFAIGDYSDNAEIIKETYHHFKNYLTLRITKLDVGEYAFAPYNKRNSNAIQGKAYVFRITN